MKPQEKSWTLKISLTEKCNYSCIYCNDGGVNPRKRGEKLSEREMKEIIKAAYECGVKKIQWTGGECTILNLPEYVKFAKKLGYTSQALTTNAFLLENMLDELINNGLNRINISLDSLNEDTYKQITGVNGLKRVKDAIIQCSKKISPLKLNIALMRKNFDEVEAFIKFAKELKGDVIVKFHELWKFEPDEIYNKEHVSEEEIYKKIKSIGKIREIDEIKGNNPSIKYYSMEYDRGIVKIGVSTLPKSYRCGGPNCSKIRVYSTGKTCESTQLMNTSYKQKVEYLKNLMDRRCTTFIKK